MPRRLLVPLVVATVCLASARPANADEVDRFTACAAQTATTSVCERAGSTFTAGQTVFLRGRVSPAHPGFGQVWRRAPYSERFVRIGVVGINDRGRARWDWTTDANDVVRGAPYTFQFRIPGHGRSWTTKLRVLEP